MNTYYIAGFPVSDELYHHGIKGQRWGIRRYQNPDGTLTEAGKKRYGQGQDISDEDKVKETEKRIARQNISKDFKNYDFLLMIWMLPRKDRLRLPILV